MPLNRFPRMVQAFFVERENALHAQRLARLAALRTKSDAEAYVRSVRERIRDAYTIENVIFESRPGFPLSASRGSRPAAS